MNGKKSTFCSLQSPSTVVVGKKRVRNTLLHVWLSPDERAKIQERMADVGIRNLYGVHGQTGPRTAYIPSSRRVRISAQASVQHHGFA